MKYKIERAWGADLREYNDVLSKYSIEYLEEDGYGLIKLNSIDELMALVKELEYGIIVNNYSDILTIHDDYLE